MLGLDKEMGSTDLFLELAIQDENLLESIKLEKDTEFDKIIKELPIEIIYNVWKYIIFTTFTFDEIIDFYYNDNNNTNNTNHNDIRLVISLLFSESTFVINYNPVPASTSSIESLSISLTPSQVPTFLEFLVLNKIKAKRLDIVNYLPTVKITNCLDDCFKEVYFYFNLKPLEKLRILNYNSLVKGITSRSIELLTDITTNAVEHADKQHDGLRFVYFRLDDYSEPEVLTTKDFEPLKRWISLNEYQKKLVLDIQGCHTIPCEFIDFLVMVDKANFELDLRYLTDSSNSESYIEEDDPCCDYFDPFKVKLEEGHDSERHLGIGDYIHEHCFRKKLKLLKDWITSLSFHCDGESDESILLVNSCVNLKCLSVNSDLYRQEKIIANDISKRKKVSMELPITLHQLNISLTNFSNLQHLDLSYVVVSSKGASARLHSNNDFFSGLDNLYSLRIHDCLFQNQYIKLPQNLSILEVSKSRNHYNLPFIVNDSDELRSFSCVRVFLDWYGFDDSIDLNEFQYFIWSLPLSLYELKIEVGYKSDDKKYCGFNQVSLVNLVGLVELELELSNIQFDYFNLEQLPKQSLKKLTLNVGNLEIKGDFSEMSKELIVNEKQVY